MNPIKGRGIFVSMSSDAFEFMYAVWRRLGSDTVKGLVRDDVLPCLLSFIERIRFLCFYIPTVPIELTM